MTLDLPLIWAGIIAIAVVFYVILDGFDLGIGILFPFAHDDAERDRMLATIKAVLGRQRDLARARRRRTPGRVSARLCRVHAGVLYPADRDAAGAGVSRRDIRVSRHRAAQAVLERRLRGRLDAGGAVPGRDPRRAGAGRRYRQRRIRRRPVRLGDAVRVRMRARRGRRLCFARRDLADHEDRRPDRRSRRPPRQRAASGGPRFHGGGEHLDAARHSRASRSAGSRCRTSSIWRRCRC